MRMRIITTFVLDNKHSLFFYMDNAFMYMYYIYVYKFRKNIRGPAELRGFV